MLVHNSDVDFTRDDVFIQSMRRCLQVATGGELQRKLSFECADVDLTPSATENAISRWCIYVATRQQFNIALSFSAASRLSR